jgi:hypothetical protein
MRSALVNKDCIASVEGAMASLNITITNVLLVHRLQMSLPVALTVAPCEVLVALRTQDDWLLGTNNC